MVNDETLSHEPEVVVDAVKKEARDSASEARKTEKKSATNRRDEEPDRARFSNEIRQRRRPRRPFREIFSTRSNFARCMWTDRMRSPSRTLERIGVRRGR